MIIESDNIDKIIRKCVSEKSNQKANFANDYWITEQHS